jgi:hypothetical protein
MNTCGVPLFDIVHAAFIAPGIKRFVIPPDHRTSDPERGTGNIVVRSAGKTTHLLNLLESGTHPRRRGAAWKAL